MNLIDELVKIDSVIAAGEYAFRGDRFSYVGELTDELAKMASVMCRATTMAVHMQTDMMSSLGKDCGCSPARGWVVNGDKISACVIGNIFCFIQNGEGNLNNVVKLLIARVEDQSGDLV